MALTSHQRGWCVLKFYKTNSVVTVQCAFKRKFNVDPPTNKSSGGTWRTVYVPPLPATVDKLQERITAAVNSVTPDMLQRVWSDLDYRIDVCRVTRGGHIECVWYHMKLYEFMQVWPPVLYEYTSKFWFYNYLKSRRVFVFTLYKPPLVTSRWLAQFIKDQYHRRLAVEVCKSDTTLFLSAY